MTKQKTIISMQNAEIAVLSHNDDDFISLTDIIKNFGDDV